MTRSHPGIEQRFLWGHPRPAIYEVLCMRRSPGHRLRQRMASPRSAPTTPTASLDIIYIQIHENLWNTLKVLRGQEAILGSSRADGVCAEPQTKWGRGDGGREDYLRLKWKQLQIHLVLPWLIEVIPMLLPIVSPLPLVIPIPLPIIVCHHLHPHCRS